VSRLLTSGSRLSKQRHIHQAAYAQGPERTLGPPPPAAGWEGPRGRGGFGGLIGRGSAPEKHDPGRLSCLRNGHVPTPELPFQAAGEGAQRPQNRCHAVHTPRSRSTLKTSDLLSRKSGSVDRNETRKLAAGTHNGLAAAATLLAGGRGRRCASHARALWPSCCADASVPP
jgi:hypothetical protein